MFKITKKVKKELQQLSGGLKPVFYKTPKTGETLFEANHTRRMTEAYKSEGQIGVANYIKKQTDLIKEGSK